MCAIHIANKNNTQLLLFFPSFLPLSQTMQQALRARQANMDSVNHAGDQLKREARIMGAAIPDPLQDKLDKLNSDWAKIQYLASRLKPTTDFEVEQKVIMQRTSMCDFLSLFYIFIINVRS